MNRNTASKLVTPLAAVLLGAAITLGSAGAVQAAPKPLTPAQESAIRAQMTEGGIDALTQDSLIHKLNLGLAPDSAIGVAPVSVVTENLGAAVRTTKVFPDGSRIWTQLEAPSQSGMIVPFSSMSGCATSGAWKVGCKIEVADIFSAASFIIDIKKSSSNAAQLRDMRNKTCVNTLGGCSVSGGIKRATQSSAGPAWAELTYTANAGWVTVNGAFGVRVSGNTISLY